MRWTACRAFPKLPFLHVAYYLLVGNPLVQSHAVMGATVTADSVHSCLAWLRHGFLQLTNATAGATLRLA